MSVVKKVAVHNIKLIVPAGTASPVPAIASSLGPKGINTMKFCTEFNAKTKDQYTAGVPLRVFIKVFADKSYVISIKGYSSSVLIKKLLGLKVCSKDPGKSIIANIERAKVYEIAGQVMQSMNTLDIDKAVKTVLGTVKSMGIGVV